MILPLILGFTVKPGQAYTRGGGGGVLPYMGYIGMCRCEGYVFKQFTLGSGIIIIMRAQLFEGRLALNPGINLTLVSFSLCSKAFFWIIFSVIFRASNHQLVDRRN